MMGKIFRHADDILVWIGEEADDSAFLMNLASSSRNLEGKLGLLQPLLAAEKMRTWQAT